MGFSRTNGILSYWILSQKWRVRRTKRYQPAARRLPAPSNPPNPRLTQNTVRADAGEGGVEVRVGVGPGGVVVVRAAIAVPSGVPSAVPVVAGVVTAGVPVPAPGVPAGYPTPLPEPGGLDPVAVLVPVVCGAGYPRFEVDVIVRVRLVC